MEQFWKKVERVEVPIAVLCIGIALYALITSAFDNKMQVVQAEPATQEQVQVQKQEQVGQNYQAAQVLPDAWKYIVVRSGDCYTVGTDDGTGWIISDCFSLERARKKANNMNAIGDRENEFGSKTWEVVE